LTGGGRSEKSPPNNTGMTLTSTAKLALVRAAGYSATCQDDVDRLNERIALLATIDPISRSRAMVKSALTISRYLFSLCL
jgi:hypothetical protein